jgi:hypothetical protein
MSAVEIADTKGRNCKYSELDDPLKPSWKWIFLGNEFLLGNGLYKGFCDKYVEEIFKDLLYKLLL